MSLQNIDPVYFLTPVIVVGFSLGLLVYWRLKRQLSFWTFLSSLIAYAGAIALKEAMQAVTLGPFRQAYGGSNVAMGLYFGLQTVAFEVGGAYIVARFAVSRRGMKAEDGRGYGVALGFWENGVLLGGSLLLSYVSIYVVLAGGGNLAQQVYDSLSKSAPALFYSPAAALPLIGLSILERVSSLLVHFSWGLLCVLSAALRKRSLFLLALPMGLVDFLVPFVGALGTLTFEILVFAFAVVSLAVALAVSSRVMRGHSVDDEVGAQKHY